MAILSICVPSRNRQTYFQETIRSLVRDPRRDVEFVFADNSDDGSIMNAFMEAYRNDPRITFLPSAKETFSAQDNFERVCEAATGDFVSVIGDDDYIDPDLAGLLTILTRHRPDLDCVAWSRPVYIWPIERPYPISVVVELNNRCGYMPKPEIWKRVFLWEHHAAGLPNYPFSIYHGAVSRKLMQKIKARYNNRHFENPVPDIEYGLKLAVMAENFVYSERPFSVAGICQESNGSSFGNVKKIKEIQARFAKDLGRYHEKDHYLNDFPFPSHLGNSVILAQVHIWFRKTYQIDTEGWQRNFVAACSEICPMMATREDYDIVVEDFREAFSKWEGGRHLSLFKPGPFVEPGNGVPYRGISKVGEVEGKSLLDRIYIAENVNNAMTPAAFFDIVRSIVSPVDEIDFHANTLVHQSEQRPMLKRA